MIDNDVSRCEDLNNSRLRCRRLAGERFTFQTNYLLHSKLLIDIALKRKIEDLGNRDRLCQT